MVFRFSLQYWDSFLMMINRTTRKIRNLESTWLISQGNLYWDCVFRFSGPLEQSKGVQEGGTRRRIR